MLLIASIDLLHSTTSSVCALHSAPSYRTHIRIQFVWLFLVVGRLAQERVATTQCDPLAMAMYALAIAPLINKLHHSLPTCKQVWYADDSTAAGSLSDVKKWWDEISSLGPGYGYFPNCSKTYLISGGFRGGSRVAKEPPFLPGCESFLFCFSIQRLY